MVAAACVPGEEPLKSPKEINHSLIDYCGPLLLGPSAERMFSSCGISKAGRLTMPSDGGHSPNSRSSPLSE